MASYLVVAVWPAGMAVICAIALAVARKAAPGTADAGRKAGPAGALTARDASMATARFTVTCAVGAVVVFDAMYLLGLVVVHHGLTIDRPIMTWMTGHQVRGAAAAMRRLTKIGDTWTTWGAAGAAAACMAAAWHNRRWLPPLALGCVIVIDHFTTLALRHTFHRVGPPGSLLGTYPSGGCDRCVLFYGIIGYLLWRELSGQPKTAAWVAAAVAALGFNEAYSRVYLSLHWFTDALSGLLYGGLLLVVFIIATRLVLADPAATGRGPANQIDPALAGHASTGRGVP